MFYHTWRLSRNVEDAALMRRLEASGISLISVSEGINTQTASGKLQRNVTLAIGEYQLDQLREATKTGKRARVRDGLSNASRPPFGYRRVFEVVDATTKTIIGRDVPSEDAPIVREMFERFATGNYSALDIANWLNAQGKTTTGNWGKRPFSKDTVLAMLRNGFYAGFVAYRGLSDALSDDGKRHKRNSKRATTWVQGAHEPIITVELFERCQQMLAKRRTASLGGQRPAASRIYTFGKIAYCAQCGGRLRGMRWGEPGSAREDRAYRCTARERGCTCNAQYRCVPEHALLPDLDAIIAHLRLPDDVKAEAIALLRNEDTRAANERRAARLEAELQRLNRMYQAGNVDDDYYDREAARIKAELVELARDAAGDGPNIEAAIAQLDNLAGLWAAATAEERAAIVHEVFEALKVDLDARRLHSFKPRKEYADLIRSAYYMDGSDGIRIFARREGYRPRPYSVNTQGQFVAAG